MSHQRIETVQKHEMVNLIRLKQTAKLNTLEPEQNEKTADVLKKADFALDLPLLVDETARDVKILNTIAAIEKQQLESIFYPYRPTVYICQPDSDCYFIMTE